MFYYEMHCHNCVGSACSKTEPEQTVISYKEQGYSGLVITDHCGRGNTALDRALPWALQAQIFTSAYLRAKETASKLDFDVLFGMEWGYGGGKEALIYGLTPEDLIYFEGLEGTYPDSMKNGGVSQGSAANLKELAKVVHEHGGIIIAAHPFRHRDYISENSEPDLTLLDGMEEANFHDTPQDALLSLDFAAAHSDIILTCGSDCHGTAGGMMAGMAFYERIRTEKELVNAIKSGKCMALNMTGTKTEYNPVLNTFFDTFGIGYKAVGEYGMNMDVSSKETKDGKIVFYRRDNVISGILFWKTKPNLAVALKAIEDRLTLSDEEYMYMMKYL